jgi:hypothetical protein
VTSASKSASLTCVISLTEKLLERGFDSANAAGKVGIPRIGGARTSMSTGVPTRTASWTAHPTNLASRLTG